MMGKAMQCGFLGMIFLASGTFALYCRSQNYIWTAISKGNFDSYSTFDGIVNCSNACMEAQLKLRIAESVTLVTYRGCADKEDGQGHVATNKSNPHFIVQYNESYCSRNFCNYNMSNYYFFNWSPGENTAPEESGSNHCYAGLTYDSNENLKGVTCGKGYDQCYSGNASISTDFFSPVVFLKTCSWPNFTESQTLSFGPIKFNLLGSSCLGSYCNGKETVIHQWGSCCLGNYCNGTETAPQIQNILKPTPTIGYYSNDTTGPVTSFTKPDAEKGKESRPLVTGGGAGHQFNLVQPTRDPVDESTIDYYYDIDSWWPPGISAEAARLESCPFCTLLVALGIAALGSWR